jgi:hypothetical protein
MGFGLNTGFIVLSPLTTLKITICSVVRGKSTINPVFNPKPTYL